MIMQLMMQKSLKKISLRQQGVYRYLLVINLVLMSNMLIKQKEYSPLVACMFPVKSRTNWNKIVHP
jgi:hypothetical protein